MFFRMIKGALIRQRNKMLLIALTIALGASLATAMLNTVMDVSDKVNQELKTYGANIVVKPKDASLLNDIYTVEDGTDSQLNTSYLNEEDLPKLKTIFWAFNIVDFAPFLETKATTQNSTEIECVGTWFNHHLSLSTGEELDTGVAGMRSWWDIIDGEWPDEQSGSGTNGVMIGATLADDLGLKAGDTLVLNGPERTEEAVIVGIFDAGGEDDEKLFAPIDFIQKLNGMDGKVASIEVSALTTPDNELAIRAAKNPAALSAADYETWYCTAYVSAICYQIQEAIPNASAAAVRQVADSEGNILEKTQLLMILITILALVGSALGISNLVTASVMERAQEIGLLKAIGAHDGPITAMLMIEVLVTAFVGSVAGYALGFGFAQLIGHSVFGSAISMNVQVIPIVAALIALVTIAGSLPAIRMILRLDPAEVLHGSKA